MCWAASSAAALSGAFLPASDAPPAFQALWHKPGRDGLACVSCHSASGREIWMSNVATSDVRRRALRHLSVEDADSLAQLTGEMRRGLPHLAGLPFAPIDSPLLGSTPQSRDLAFAKRLAADGFPLLTADIRTLEDAKRAEAAIRAVPLDQVPIGLPLDPISRDPIRPSEGPMLGDWIPDIADSPSDLSSLAQLSRLKREALKIYEQSLASGKSPSLEGALAHAPEHPIWAVGSFARFNEDATGRSFGLSAAQAKHLGVSMDKPLHMDVVALSWFWIGWTLDPALRSMSRDRQAQNGGYMSELLWKTGPYPMHAAYFAARRPIERHTPGVALQPDFAAFVNDENLPRFAPKDPAARQAFIKVCRGILRMNCLLLSEDLKAGFHSPNPTGAVQQVRALWNYVRASDNSSENAVSQDIVRNALEALKLPAQQQSGQLPKD